MDDLNRKTIAIHQPNFLPWMGYFHKISRVDNFVFLDNVPFSKGSFTNRVKIHHSDDDQWLTVPLRKFSLGTHIKDILIDRSQHFENSFLSTLHQEYRNEKLFDQQFTFLEKGFQDSKHIDKLAEYNIFWISTIMEKLDLSCNFIRASELVQERNDEQIVLQLSKILQTDRYISGMGGKKYLDEKAFAQNGISLEYIDFAEKLSNLLPTEKQNLLFKSAVSWILDSTIENKW